MIRFAASFDATVEQLEQAESMVENLKLQLDDAMGAEDMLEHLTERNLTLSEVRISTENPALCQLSQSLSCV